MILFIILALVIGLAVNLFVKRSVDEYDHHHVVQWDQEKYWNNKGKVTKNND